MTFLYLSEASSIFPPINASLNALSVCFLLLGYWLIKTGKEKGHRIAMLCALLVSACFLGCYLYYHYTAGQKTFPRAYPVARIVYLCILIPHVVLAVVNLPLIIIAVVAALKGKFDRHRKFARIAFPVWLFVSITGVIVYFMVYQWFVEEKTAKASNLEATPRKGEYAKRAEPLPTKETTVRSGQLEFSPAVLHKKVSAGTEEVEFVYTAVNLGSEAVRITKVDSGCACIEESANPELIQPGESSRITAVYTTERVNGLAEKVLSISTDQENVRDAFLTVKLEVEPIYRIDKELTAWKKGSPPEEKSVEFRVTREKPIRVLSASSSRSEVEVALTEVQKGRRYQIRLTPAGTDQILLGVVRLETDCEIEAHARPLLYFTIR